MLIGNSEIKIIQISRNEVISEMKNTLDMSKCRLHTAVGKIGSFKHKKKHLF